MNVLEAIRRKRAVRQYKEESLTAEAVETILRAGRRAQSSKNSQPWHFIAIRDKETLVKLSQMGDYATHLPTAALAIAILTPDPAQRWSVMFDAGQAAAYMQLAAIEVGVRLMPGNAPSPRACESAAWLSRPLAPERAYILRLPR